MTNTDTGAALMTAILAHPEDDAPRLIYADWLEEQGSPLGPCLRDVVRCSARVFATQRVAGGHDAITLMQACRLVFPKTKRIDRLDEKQSAMLGSFRDAWLAVGLGCGGYDLEAVKSLIGEAYQAAGLPRPVTFVELPSPLHGVIGAMSLSRLASVRASVRDSVWDSVWASVGDSVCASVRDSVWNSVWDSVWASVRDSVWESVWASVGDSVCASVRDSVWESVWDSVWDSVGDSVCASLQTDEARGWIGKAVYGLHDAHWLGFYSVFSAFGLQAADKLRPLMRLATQIGWWWPFQNAVIITPRPQSITMDGKRLVEVSWRDFVVKGR